MRLTALFVLVLSLSACGVHSGNGRKVGQIVKVSTQGAFCPTIEVQLVRGGFNGGTGVNGQAFDFTIEGQPDLEAAAQRYMDAGTEVEVRYHSYLATICRSDSDHFADAIILVKR